MRDTTPGRGGVNPASSRGDGRGHDPWRRQQCLWKVCTQGCSVLALGVHSAHVPRGVPQRAVAAAPAPLSVAQRARTVWEERAPRNFQQGPRLGGKLGHCGRDTSARPHCAPELSRTVGLRARTGVRGHRVHGRGGLGLWRELGFLAKCVLKCVSGGSPPAGRGGGRGPACRGLAHGHSHLLTLGYTAVWDLL